MLTNEGFLAVGTLAFLLGVAVTILCFRLKQWQELKDRDNT